MVGARTKSRTKGKLLSRLFTSPSGRVISASQAEFQRNVFMPYGEWTCSSGRLVLFNRFYEPIWSRWNGLTTPADPREWVKGLAVQRWFYSEQDSERQKTEKAKAALQAWGLPTDIPV